MRYQLDSFYCTYVLNKKQIFHSTLRIRSILYTRKFGKNLICSTWMPCSHLKEVVKSSLWECSKIIGSTWIILSTFFVFLLLLNKNVWILIPLNLLLCMLARISFQKNKSNWLHSYWLGVYILAQLPPSSLHI